jgi:hypothetical protein
MSYLYWNLTVRFYIINLTKNFSYQGENSVKNKRILEYPISRKYNINYLDNVNLCSLGTL